MTIVPGSCDDLLELDLSESSILAAPPYRALSYECGTPGDIEDIYIARKEARAPRKLL